MTPYVQYRYLSDSIADESLSFETLSLDRHARRFSGTNLVVICPSDLWGTDDTDAPRPRVFTAKAIEAAPSHESLLSARTAFAPRLSAK